MNSATACSRCGGSRRLVISFFATVGNYDYGFYWYLYQDGTIQLQDGTIQLETKLTGIIQTAAVMPGAKYPWGGMVDDNLGGPTHQHFFNVRLHMDLDGGGNSVTEHEFAPRPWGADNPYGNVFDQKSRTLSRELDAAAVADGQSGRYWKIVNPASKNSVGNPTGYKLMVTPSPLMLAQEGSFVRKRGGFATKHVWVTAYDPAEKYASGDYPNVHAGNDGLPRYVQQNRNIENTDIVVWHSFGHTPRVQAGGLSGDAGRICRVHAEAQRLLRGQSRQRHRAGSQRSKRVERCRAGDAGRRGRRLLPQEVKALAMRDFMSIAPSVAGL